MTNEEFTPILLTEIRKMIEDESHFQDQRSEPNQGAQYFLYKLSMRLDQLHLNLKNRDVVPGKFQSLHLKNPYKQ